MRGFSILHLDLARRLFHPDPAERIRLAQTLPTLQSVNTTPWLIWLSRDSDPDVRMAAIDQLARHGDAEGHRELARLSREDPQAAVREHAMQAIRESSTTVWR